MDLSDVLKLLDLAGRGGSRLWLETGSEGETGLDWADCTALGRAERAWVKDLGY
jgi:hypothetical protein